MHTQRLVAGRMFMKTLSVKTDGLISHIACKLLTAGKHNMASLSVHLVYLQLAFLIVHVISSANSSVSPVLCCVGSA